MPDRDRFPASSSPRMLSSRPASARAGWPISPDKASSKRTSSIAIEAARMRGEAMDHVLLYGPPGLGKTTLASIIAEELEVTFTTTSGPGTAEETRPHRHPEQHPAAPGLLHRRNPPPAARRGRDAVLGAGGFPRGHPGGRRPGRAHALAAHAEVHGHRRHHAPGPGERAVARPLRPGAAARPLHRRRVEDHREAFGAAAECGDRRWRRRGNRAPLPRDAAHRQPPAAPRPRLRPGARRRPHHASRWRRPR